MTEKDIMTEEEILVRFIAALSVFMKMTSRF